MRIPTTLDLNSVLDNDDIKENRSRVLAVSYMVAKFSTPTKYTNNNMPEKSFYLSQNKWSSRNIPISSMR